MKKYSTAGLGLGLVMTVLLAIQGSGQSLADEPVKSSEPVVVTALVTPYLEVEVDGSGRIIKVISNSREEIAPTFVRYTPERVEVEDCQICQTNFDHLKDQLDFSRMGLLYQSN